MPANVLPPDRGTMFITGPPMSLSPRPPPTVTPTSSRVDGVVDVRRDAAAARRRDRHAVDRHAAFAGDRLELIVLECALKNVIVGDSAAPLCRPSGRA